jgi:hypothetical protein
MVVLIAGGHRCENRRCCVFRAVAQLWTNSWTRAAWVKVACVAAAAATAAVADRAARTTHISERQVPGPSINSDGRQSSRRGEQQEGARSAFVSGRTGWKQVDYFVIIQLN